MEQYLGIARTDVFSGGELIGLYHDYVKNPSEFTEKHCFLHNADDLKGMLEVLPILAYYDLFNENCVKAKKYRPTITKMSVAHNAELLIPRRFPLPAQTGNRFCGGAAISVEKENRLL